MEEVLFWDTLITTIQSKIVPHLSAEFCARTRHTLIFVICQMVTSSWPWVVAGSMFTQMLTHMSLKSLMI